MQIEQLSNNSRMKIKPLWEELNRDHELLSTHFKSHFASFTAAIALN